MSRNEQRMRISLDARPLTTSRAGIATYCRGLLEGFRRIDAPVDLVLYAKDPMPADIRQASLSIQWRRLPAPLWLPVAIPRALHASRVDLFHGTNHMIPPLSPVPAVVTIHDLSALTLPQYHTWRNRLLSVPQMLLALYRATRIIADSSYTAQDIIRRVPGVNPACIRAIPIAPAPGLAPASNDAVRDLVARVALPETFFLFLGALEPRKNVITLIRALHALREQGKAVPLVIAGAEGWRNDDVYAEVQQLGVEPLVRFIGYVPARDIPALYGAARALVYPSLFEGFGLPPLEAMACGTPVICSKTSSLPEVVGDAALLVDPRSVRELVQAMRAILHDDALRRRLQAEGRARAALFSWERTARETLQVYEEAIRDGRR